MRYRRMGRQAGQTVRSWFYLCGCLVVLGILCIRYIFPSLSALARLNTEVRETEGQLERQRIYVPLLADVQALQSATVMPEMLLPSGQEPMQRSEIIQLPDRLDQLAVEAGVDIHQTVPRHILFEDGRKFMIVDLEGEGRFQDLRNFVIQVTRMNPFACLESLSISQGGDGQERFTLKAWLALK